MAISGRRKEAMLSDMESSVLAKIADAPTAPGVYLMKDSNGRVFYVGKAVNLRDRLRSYAAGADTRPFVPLLDGLLADIETLVVHNEKEALLLENELIRRYRPRFNMRPGGGRNFAYLRLDTSQRYPRLEVTRQVRSDGARYFGPYPLAHALRETLRVINRHFKLRTCADHDPAVHPNRVCLLCQISRFPSPSVYDIPEEEYRRNVENAIRFLEGQRSELVAELRERMESAAAAMHFEEAARLRDQLGAITQTLQPQKIITAEMLDQDAVGLDREGNRVTVYVLSARRGRVTGGQAFPFSALQFPESEVLASFLNFYYGEGHPIPDDVLLPMDIEGRKTLAALLSDRKGARVRILVPARGARRELVDMSLRNAQENLRRQHPETVDAAHALERLRDRLGLARVPHRMECFDISHFQGGDIVASRVSMIDGRPDKAHYRRYRIRTVEVGDDFAAMYEVVLRRLRRGLEEQDLPDLIVIDGGKGQLGSAQAAIKDVGAHAVEVIALAKERATGTQGAPYGRRGQRPERVFVPNRRDPVILPADSPEMHILARIRDEAHRFAITYQRKLMRQARMHSELESVPGIGTGRRKALLRHFGSVDRVREASVDELAQVSGVGHALAEQLYTRLHAARTSLEQHG